MKNTLQSAQLLLVGAAVVTILTGYEESISELEALNPYFELLVAPVFVGATVVMSLSILVLAGLRLMNWHATRRSVRTQATLTDARWLFQHLTRSEHAEVVLRTPPDDVDKAKAQIICDSLVADGLLPRPKRSPGDLKELISHLAKLIALIETRGLKVAKSSSVSER